MKIKMIVGFRGVETGEQFWPPGSEQDANPLLAEQLIGHKKAIAIEERDYSKLGYRKLQNLCKEHGLNAKGSTEELIARLEG